MRRCMSRNSSSSKRHDQVLAAAARAARRAGRRARRAPRRGASGAVQRGSRISADASSMRPSSAARAGGGPSRPRAARASRRELSRAAHGRTASGQRGRSRPASQRSTLAPTSASGPSWRRAAVAVRSAASSGACSRVWSVPGVRRVAAVVGGQDQQVVRRAGRSSQRADRARRSRAARAWKPCDVLAVAVDLVGLDQVREHEAARRGSSSSAVVAASASRVRRARVRLRRRRRRRTAAPTLPTAWTGDAVGLQLLEVASAPAARARSRGGRAVRSKAPGSPANGRAITRPTACSPVISLARRARRSRTAPPAGTTSSCAAICSTESCEV